MPAASGNNSSNFSRPNVGTARPGRPVGISPVTGTPSAGRPRTGREQDGPGDHCQPDRPAGQKALAEQQQQDGDDADRQHRPVSAAELTDQL